MYWIENKIVEYVNYKIVSTKIVNTKAPLQTL